MHYVIVGFCVLLALTFVFVFLGLLAPSGYEDEDGFHFGIPASVRLEMLAAPKPETNKRRFQFPALIKALIGRRQPPLTPARPAPSYASGDDNSQDRLEIPVPLEFPLAP